MPIVSDQLPGETPINDLSGLKLKRIKTRDELNEAEAEGIRKAIVKYLAAKPSRRLAPFDLAWVKCLHREMFGTVWTWAKVFRTRDLNIGVPWHQVQERMQNLLDDLTFWERSHVNLLEQATWLHHRSIPIHPFMNGNGRWGRLLTNIRLRMHDAPILAWPEQTVGAVSTVRERYLAALRAADDGDLEPLASLHRDFAEKS